MDNHLPLSQFYRWQSPYKDLCEKNWLDLLSHGLINEDKTLSLKMVTHQIGRVLILNQKQISSGYQWGNYYFMAPLFFFQLLNELGTRCEYLSTFATVNRGITTNCNDFFILHQISPGRYQNGFGDIFELPNQVLIPLIESPRLYEYPILQKHQLNSYLFYTDLSKSDLIAQKLDSVLNYVLYGEKVPLKASKGTIKGKLLQGVISLPTFKPKYQKRPDKWYCLKSKSSARKNLIPAHIFFQKIYDTTFKIFYSEDELLSNNTFYEIRLKPDCPVSPFQLFSILSGSLTTLCLELNGRTNFGGGAIDTATFDIEKIICPNLEMISSSSWKQIHQIMERYTSRKILSFPEEQLQNDKISLDTILLKQFDLQITVPQFYSAIQEIQAIRISKSNSL